MGKKTSVVDDIKAVVRRSMGRFIPSELLESVASRIEDEYVELPVDKDGVPIKVGDTVYLGYGDVKYLVTGLSYDITSVSVHVERGLDIGWYSPENVSHEQRPDSLERIADDIEEGKKTVFIDGSTISDWADRIRRLAKEASDD